MDISQRLSAVEDDFFSALASGGSALESFKDKLSTLVNDFDQALHDKTPDRGLVASAHSLASRIQVISSHFLKSFTDLETLPIDSQLHLDDIPCTPSTTDKSPLTPPRSPNASSGGSLRREKRSRSTSLRTPTADDVPRDSGPVYIAAACKWLLRNLHDPYPSSQVKQEISDRSGASLRHINAWFMNARRRMGWTILSRKHFSLCRSETVDAAYRALVAEDPKRPLESDIILDFIALKVTAESLYSEKFRKSVLAAKLDAAVKNMTGEDRATHNTASDRKQLQSSNSKLPEVHDSIVRNSEKQAYPSPDRSTQCSPEPCPPCPSTMEETNDLIPDPVAGRKRRITNLSDSDPDTLDASQDRPKKCLRTSIHQMSPRTSPITFPLSPQSLCPGTPSNLEHCSPVSPLSNLSCDTGVVDSDPPRNRQRRLSDMDGQGPPKRPRGLPIGPRMQSVSDPLPLSIAVSEATKLDDWFQCNFDMPGVATTDDLDPSTPIEIKQWTSLDCNVEDYPMQLNEAIYAQQVEISCGELQSVAAGGFDLMSFPLLEDNAVDLINKNEFLLDGLGSSAPLALPSPDQESVELVKGRDLSEANTVDLACLTPFVSDIPFDIDPNDLFNIPNLASPRYPFSTTFPPSDQQSGDLTATSPFPSSPASPPELLHDIWTALSANPTSTPTPEVSFDDILSRRLPDIDPSLFLSHIPSPTTILDQHYQGAPSDTATQAIWHELQTHRAAVRRLETELALSASS